VISPAVRFATIRRFAGTPTGSGETMPLFSHPRLSLAAAAVAALFSHAAFSEGDATILVTATRQATRHNELLSDASVITREEIAKSAPLQTLGELLTREGGVETATTGAPGGVSNIFIRGANGGHTLLLIDGQRVGSATLGEPSIQRIPLAQIERVEILRGPASALYGSDAIGGVIQIFTRPAVEGTKVTADASVGSFNTREANAGVSTQSGPVSASLRAGVLKSDGFNAIHNPNNLAFNPDRDGYENKHLSGSLAFRFDPRNEIGASVFHSDGENQYDNAFDASFSLNPGFDYRTRHKVSSGSIFSDNRLNDVWTSKLRLGKSIDDSKSSEGPGQSSDFKTSQSQLSWQNDLTLPIGKAMLTVERLRQAIDSSGTYVLTERTIDSAQAGWTGSLGQHRVQANLRNDHNSQFGGKTTGNLGYGYQLNDEWRLRSSFGTAFKAPTFNDLYFPDSGFGGGNPNLKPEKAKSGEVGISRDSANGTLALTAHRSDVSQLIEWQPDDPSNVFGPWHPVNVGEARLKGVSFSGKQRYGSISIHATADWQDNENEATGKQLVLRARRHGSLGVEQQYGSMLFGANLQASGRRFNDAANTVILAGYSVVNLHLEQQLSKDFSLFAKANNVFDRFYEVRDDFATAGRSFFLGVRYGSL
jgi:vitamin B12 transporter